MNPKILLRIAAGIIMLHAIGHIMGMAQWMQAGNAEQQAVISSMTDHHFPFMGAVHSFADSFTGFGTGCTIFLLLMVALLWLVSSFCASLPQISIKILYILFIGLLSWGTLEFIYFFPAATIMTLLATILTGISILILKKKS